MEQARQDPEYNHKNTKRYLPRFTIQSSNSYKDPQAPPGYVIGSINGKKTDVPAVGDIPVSINGRSVGLRQEDDAFGDLTWFLSEGAKIDLVIHRLSNNTQTFKSHNFRSQVVVFEDTDVDTYKSQVLVLR